MKDIESNITLSDRVLTPNGSSYYHPCYIDGVQLVFFTQDQLKIAIERGNKYNSFYNCKAKKKSFIEKFIELFK